jgi:hypothetical protein
VRRPGPGAVLAARPHRPGSGSTRAPSIDASAIFGQYSARLRAPAASSVIASVPALSERASRAPADEDRADVHPVGEGRDLRHLGTVAHAEAYRHRQVGVLADPLDQAGRVAADRVPGAGEAHQRDPR